MFFGCLIIYMVGLTYLMDFVRFFCMDVHFNYPFQQQCENIVD